MHPVTAILVGGCKVFEKSEFLAKQVADSGEKFWKHWKNPCRTLLLELLDAMVDVVVSCRAGRNVLPSFQLRVQQL